MPRQSVSSGRQHHTIRDPLGFEETTFHGLLGGLDSFHDPAEIPQDPGNLVRMAQANEVFASRINYGLQTRPGMTDVRATAVNASAISTGMRHQGDLADNFLLTWSIAGTDHDLYQDSANPPVAIAGGTKFTIGGTNLVDMLNFTDGTNPGTICMSRLRDTPQFVTGGVVRTNLSITSTLLPQFGEVFGQRALYGAPSVSGTVQGQRVYWSDVRNGKTLTDVTTQFQSFETDAGGNVLALRKLSDVCIVGLLNNIFLLAVSPAATNPFAVRELPSGRYKGPVSHHGLITAETSALWIGQQNLHMLTLDGIVHDIGDAIQTTIAGLTDAQRAFAVAGYDGDNHLILWSVANAPSATNNLVIGYNLKTGECYLWTLSVNAMAQRLVSSKNRLVLGGYVGKFRNWNQGTTGVADNAATAIGFDVITPRHHLGTPDWVKLFLGVKVLFDPQLTSEVVTVSYRLNDTSAWIAMPESPYTVTATAGDEDEKYFSLGKAGTHLQLEFKDANSGQVLRVTGYTIVWKLLHPAVVR